MKHNHRTVKKLKGDLCTRFIEGDSPIKFYIKTKLLTHVLASNTKFCTTLPLLVCNFHVCTLSMVTLLPKTATFSGVPPSYAEHVIVFPLWVKTDYLYCISNDIHGCNLFAGKEVTSYGSNWFTLLLLCTSAPLVLCCDRFDHKAWTGRHGNGGL